MLRQQGFRRLVVGGKGAVETEELMEQLQRAGIELVSGVTAGLHVTSSG